MLLIAGGQKDHNLHRLADAAQSREYPFRVLFHDGESVPQISWNIGQDYIHVNGEEIPARGAALFIRYDVYSLMDNPNAGEQGRANTAWFDALRGWALAHPEVAMLNRGNENREVSKPRALMLALQAGFSIPNTAITNMFEDCQGDFIIKPVSGGAHTRELHEALKTGETAPGIVQEKLTYPEMRIFRVGKYFYAFDIGSKTLDSRDDKELKLTQVEPPAPLVERLERLCDRMGLNYAAADFKTRPDTGELVFLEVNTMPIFTGYDTATEGKLSDAMFLTLYDLTVK